MGQVGILFSIQTNVLYDIYLEPYLLIGMKKRKSMELEKQGRKYQLHTPEFCVFHMESMLESIKNIPPTKALHETTILGKIFKPKG